MRKARGADRNTAKASLADAIGAHHVASVALSQFDKKYSHLSKPTAPLGTVTLITPPPGILGELDLRSRVKWSVQAGWVQTEHVLVDQDHETMWENGNPRTAVMALHICEIPCYAVVARDGELLQHQLLDRIYIRFAPAGHVWVFDKNGVALANTVSRQDRYHLTSTEMQSASDTWLVGKVAQAHTVRLRAEAQKAVDETEIKGIMVHFQDSIDAGNCQAGTIAWAERHRIDISRAYEASELLRLADEDDLGRVRLVIRHAIIRNKREAEEKAALAVDPTELARLEAMASEVASIEQTKQNANAEIDAAVNEAIAETSVVEKVEATSELVTITTIATSVKSAQAA